MSSVSLDIMHRCANRRRLVDNDVTSIAGNRGGSRAGGRADAVDRLDDVRARLSEDDHHTAGLPLASRPVRMSSTESGDARRRECAPGAPLR